MMTWNDLDTLKMLIQKIEDGEILTRKETQEALRVVMQYIRDKVYDGLES